MFQNISREIIGCAGREVSFCDLTHSSSYITSTHPVNESPVQRE